MIPTDKIRDLIGKGGATIRGIIEQTGAKIDVDDTGRSMLPPATARA
jgi:polyribonucleotide nucleotidyltransferase